jgi:hypothetical protein
MAGTVHRGNSSTMGKKGKRQHHRREEQDTMNKSLSFIIAGLLCLLGVTLPAVLPAQAVNGLTGICESGTNSCWRVAPGDGQGGAIDLWARDISGDLWQDFDSTYFGSLGEDYYTRSDCNPNFESWDRNYIGDGVYFIGPIVNQDLVTSPGNAVEETTNRVIDASTLWIWTPAGNLINCANSDYWNSPQGIEPTFNYDQLVTSSSNWARWQQIDPPARR